MSKRRLGKIGQRILAFVISVTLVLGGIPFTSLAANQGIDNKIVDPSTLHLWENWFGEDSTEFAGGVWSDKSVFKTADEFETALGNSSMNINMTDEENFMVALSALASNKEIVGYSTVPTDTILILDVSESMDDSSSVPQMVASANEAIKELQELNKNNRVGIVLYSGNTNAGASNTSTGTLLLELDRYTADADEKYIEYTGTSSATRVRTVEDLKKEKGGSITQKSKTTDGGTYIQNGLSIAMDEFEAAEDKVIPQGNVQAGTKRMPIIVLMSDGAPTTGTYSYTNIGTSNVGNGTGSSAGLGFMTQLTAAYLKEQVEAWYGQAPKFYTLGLNISGNGTSQYIAQSVMNPANSLNAINTYWDDLFSSRNRASFYSPGTASRNNQDIWVTVQRNTNDGLERTDQNYVDKYFAATGNTGLEGAFTDIVNEIIIQSAYYPTALEGANTDLDGYLTIEDEIGQFMEVKNITGLMMGDNQLFTGAALTRMMGTDAFGDRYTYTELGWELVESVSERIGVSQDLAIELLKMAWADGQLSYTNDTTFSNYIGWYEDENNGYLAHWNDSHTKDDVPANAKYITRSYGFFGTVQNGTIEALGSDMMHIVVKVRTEITTGHQDVVWQIPAALIPVVTYHVELDTDSFDTARDVTMYREDEKPIRLLFEVGLRSDINELNINEKLAHKNLVTGQHVHKNNDGTYTFYTNQWGDGDGGSIDYNKPYEHIVTASHFHPNVENERYYYTEDTLIYTNTGTAQNPVYTPYAGATDPIGTGYYYARRVFTSTSSLTDEAKIEYVYAPIAAATLETHQKKIDSNYYIEKGTIYQELERFQKMTEKSDNATETLDYYAHHTVAPPGVGSAEYDVWAYLGNNGKMTVTPATGIKLTKLVDDTVTDTDAIFKFTVELEGGDYDGTYRFVDADGTYGTITFTNNKSSVIEMKANETVYVIDLPVGATYKVVETNENTAYKVDHVLVNGSRMTDLVATGTIVSKQLADVEFLNTTRLYGDLIISKTVTHDYGANYTIPADKKFNVEVTLGLANGTRVETSVGAKTVAEGKITFELGHNESATIYNLVEGTTYSVAETNLPTGFTLKTGAADRQGIIDVAGSEVDLVNHYAPETYAPTAAIDVNVQKNLVDVAGNPMNWNGKQYSFHLEMLEGNAWVDVPGATGVANAIQDNFTVKIPRNYLTTIGTYSFRVHEDANNAQEGIISDTAVYFSIVVTDKDMDGALEIDAVLVDNVPIPNPQEVDLEFTNTYVVTGSLVVPIPIKKTLKNETGVALLPAGFEFGLYEGTTEVGKATTNANGDATIYMSYGADWFNNQTKTNNQVSKTYVLKEIEGTKKGMNYTKAEYSVNVVIGLDGNNALQLASKTITDANSQPVTTATFENEYKLTATSFSVSGTKNLTGREIGNDKYTFNLYETGSDFGVATGTLIDSTENVGKDFRLEDDLVATAGTHYYVIEEAAGTISGVTYDTTKYHVTVIARDNNNGGLTIAANDISIVKVGVGVVNTVTFENVYQAEPDSIVIEASKVLTGKALEHDMFEFVLKEGNTEIATAKSSATGKITFPRITYTKAGRHVYTVTEKNDGKIGYTYDDSSFAVTVEVTDDGMGQLDARIQGVVETDGADEENIQDTSVVFRNRYLPNPVSVTLNAVKLLENRHLINREFTFQLFETGSDFGINSSAIETAHNSDNGTIVFKHQITAAGTYYFVMKEDTSNPKAEIVYDNTEYQITVVVYDIGGALAARTSYAIEGRPVENLVFSNVFVPQDPVQKEVHKKGTPDINIDGEPVKAGDILTYEIDYTNQTNVEQDDLVITDTIPTGTTYVEGSASTEGFVSHVNGVLTWEFDNVPAGEKVVVTFDVKVNEGKATITNQAHVEQGGNSWNTNAVTNYTFDKEVDKSEVKIGEEVTYTILYKNTEQEVADIQIVDKLVEGLTYVEGSATRGGVYDKETHTITWNISNVAVMADGEVSFKAIVNEQAVEIIDNVASIKVGNDAAITVETDTVETKVFAPELEFTKKQALNNEEATTAVIQAKKGDKVTYYLTVKNIGNLAAEDITLTDKVPQGLKVDENSISSKGVLKDGVITWTIDELKADESITVSFTVTVTEDNKAAKYANIAQTVYENDPTDPDEPQKTNEVIFEYVVETSPKTGDNSSIGIWSGLAFSSLMACGVLLILDKKRKNEV